MSSSASDNVTDEDIRLFKTTLLARRFPGLKDMKDEDIKTLILADRKATGRRQQAEQKAYPKTEYELPPVKRDTLPQGIATTFSPVNPHQAKQDIMRPYKEGFNGVGSPYDADRMDFVQDKHSDETKRMAPFVPPCPMQAKTTIAVDYYLNSADTESKMAELEATKRKAREHRAAYDETYATRKGLTLV